MSLQIIGAGFGRTGTKSLQLALEKLGFGPCYHMEELLRNPHHVQHWDDAYQQQPVDWDALFDGYKAAVDFPTAMYYNDLATHYPAARVILSVRDADRWYDSVCKTIFSFDPGVRLKLKMLMMLPFSSTARNLLRVIRLNNKAVWGHLFGGRFKDRSHAIYTYHRHIDEVQASIPANRLLIFRAADGWEPLCEYLGVPVPNEPFPRVNAMDKFHDWARSMVRDVLRLRDQRLSTTQQLKTSQPPA